MARWAAISRGADGYMTMAPILLERARERIVGVPGSDPSVLLTAPLVGLVDGATSPKPTVRVTLGAMDRVVMVAHLRPDARERARELLAQERASPAVEGAFDRIGIFLSESEIVFFFEGRDADESIRAIFNDPVRSSEIGHWLPLFDGPLHRAPEAYFWERKGARPS